MLIVAGIVHVKPEARDIAMKAMSEVMAETVKEPGCISYVFSPDISDPRPLPSFRGVGVAGASERPFRDPAYRRVPQNPAGIRRRTRRAKNLQHLGLASSLAPNS